MSAVSVRSYRQKALRFQCAMTPSLARIVQHDFDFRLCRGSRAHVTRPIAILRARRALGDLGMSFLKQKLSIPVVKYSALAVASGLWVFGLIDHVYSSAATMKYLLMSLLMAAVAFI